MAAVESLIVANLAVECLAAAVAVRDSSVLVNFFNSLGAALSGRPTHEVCCNYLV